MDNTSSIYQNKYRIGSARLKNWDYSSGVYCVTICTKERTLYFGDVIDGKVILSKIGTLANQCWVEIPRHFPMVELDAYVIMPNHVHGIIVINSGNGVCRDAKFCVSTNKFAGNYIRPDRFNTFGPQSRNLASIIRGYKAGVKKWATINNIQFGWQERFYDRIIRNEKELNRIREYIMNNPLNWPRDEENIQTRSMRGRRESK